MRKSNRLGVRVTVSMSQVKASQSERNGGIGKGKIVGEECHDLNFIRIKTILTVGSS